MKKRLWILPLALIAVAGLFTTGCEDMWADQDQGALVRTSGVTGHPIIAGQNYTAGYVYVWQEGDYIHVEAILDEPWEMSQIHLAWADVCANLPRNKKGNLVPGQFPVSENFDPWVTHWSYSIPLSDVVWTAEGSIALSVHFVVWDTSKEPDQTETGWGDNWDGCFPFYRTKEVLLPDGWITMEIVDSPWLDRDCQMKIELSDVPTDDDYNVWDGFWEGWCCEKGAPIWPDTPYQVKLHSSLSPGDLPERALEGLYGDRLWDRVNYLLNRLATWRDSAGADVYDFFPAFRYLTGDLQSKPADMAGDIVDDAMLNGYHFMPEAGEWFAVILEPKTVDEQEFQFVFIKVDP